MGFRTVLALLCLAAVPATATIISVNPSTQTISPGATFSVDLNVDSVTDLYGWQFDLAFDPTILAAVDIIEGPFLATGGATLFLPGSIDNTGGSISFNADSLQGPVSGVTGTNGTLATVHFEAIGAGTTALSLSNLLLSDSNLNSIAVSGQDGAATVTPEPSAAWVVLGGAVLLGAARRRALRGRHALAMVAAASLATAHAATTDITTAQVDASRTNANPAEIYLTTSNVNVSKFGKLFTRTVDGGILTQPLYLQGVTIGAQKHNVVYVATLHDMVYAFDADDSTASTPLWSVSLGTYDTPSGWTTGLGVLSTPHIVRSTGTMYVVAATRESSNRVYRLHALDITTGAEKFGGPVVISGSVTGSAGDAVNGVVSFSANRVVQRTGLAAAGNNLIVAFAGDRDHGPYHGWVLSYDMTTLAQTGINTAARNNPSTNGEGNGIWQSGRAPAVDGNGKVYLETGNGPNDGANDFGESFLKLTPGTNSLAISDWFTPSNWATLNQYDYDVSSTGPTLISSGSLVFGGSKTGTVYLMPTSSLGHQTVGDTGLTQSFLATSGCQTPLSSQGCAQIMGHVYWSTASTPKLYVWGVHDVLRAFQFSGGQFVTTASDTGSAQANYPGGVLTMSSYVGTSGTGILWAITNDTADNGFYFGPGFTGSATLHAYDANNLSNELWNSGQNSARDSAGTFASFAPPIAVNGKVYVPTFSNQLVVYGLLNGSVRGDVDGDSSVTCADVTIVKASYGKSTGQSGFDLRADVNGDGVVNLIDLATVMRSLPSGTTCH